MKTNTKNDELRLKACKQYNVGRILDDWLHTWSPTDVRIIIVNSLYESINWKSFCREKITIEFIFELKLYSESSLFFFFHEWYQIFNLSNARNNFRKKWLVFEIFLIQFISRLNLRNMVDFSEAYNEVHLLSFLFITEEFST